MSVVQTVSCTTQTNTQQLILSQHQLFSSFTSIPIAAGFSRLPFFFVCFTSSTYMQCTQMRGSARGRRSQLTAAANQVEASQPPAPLLITLNLLSPQRFNHSAAPCSSRPNDSNRPYPASMGRNPIQQSMVNISACTERNLVRAISFSEFRLCRRCFLKLPRNGGNWPKQTARELEFLYHLRANPHAVGRRARRTRRGTHGLVGAAARMQGYCLGSI